MDGATPKSFTVTTVTRIGDADGTVVVNRTLRVGPDGAVHTETRRRVTGSNGSVTVTETYTTENVTYVCHTVPGTDASTYERVATDDDADESLVGVRALDEQFEFAHERADDGSHRFTVDSADQVVGDPWDGEVQCVSVVVVVTASGVVTELDYDLVLTTAGGSGTVEYHTDRTVSERGSTSVAPPEWLPEAKPRTRP